MAISFEPLPSDAPRRALPSAFYRLHTHLQPPLTYTTAYTSEAAAFSHVRHLMNTSATPPTTFSIGKIPVGDLDLFPIWIDYPNDMSVGAVRLPVWARGLGARPVDRRSRVIFCMNEVKDMLGVEREDEGNDEWVFLNGSMRGVVEEVRTYSVAELEFGTEGKRGGMLKRFWALLKENLVTRIDWRGYERRQADSEVWLMMSSQRSLGRIRD